MSVRYKIRINVRKLKSGIMYAYVSMSDDVAAMFTKPYVSVKRMQDRLAFCPWDNKTAGTVKIGKNAMQFGVQEDCEKMKEFGGQYYLVNKTDSGVVFVKLADRHPFDREVGEYNGSAHDKVSTPVENKVFDNRTELPPNTTLVLEKPIGLYECVNAPSLSELLKKAAEEKEEELVVAQADVDAAKALLNDAEKRWDKINEECRAYWFAYNVAIGGGK